MKIYAFIAMVSFVLSYCHDEETNPSRSKKVYYLQDYPGNLYRVNVDGSADEQLTTEGDYGNLDVSADGKRIVFASSAGDNWNIYIADLDASGIMNKKVLYGSDYRDEDAKFSPDGKSIVFKTNQWGIEDHGSRNVYDLCILDIATLKLARLTSNTDAEAWAPCFSPDGQRIAYVLRKEGAGSVSDEIYTVNTDGSNLKRITNNDFADWYPSFSKDGNLIYASKKVAECDDDLYQIKKAHLTSSDPGSKVTKLKINACNNISDADPYSSKTDEEGLVFVSTREEGYDIYLGNKSSGAVFPVIKKTGVNLLGPVLSR